MKYLIVATITSLLVFIYRHLALSMKIIDHPNERSMHVTPVPRGAGVAFVGISLAASFFTMLRPEIQNTWLPTLLIASLIVAMTGFIDDVIGLSAKVRFVLHVVAGCIVVYPLSALQSLDLGILKLNLGIAGNALAVLAVVWSINFYNFMDGVNGIATLQGIFVFGVGGYISSVHGADALASLSYLIASALLGFLWWNFPRAKVFMGDIGSGFLGLVFAAVALVSEQLFGIPVLIWVLLNGVFIFDATITLMRRFINGEKWYAAHRSHAYQRLSNAPGWNQKRVVITIFTINIGIGGLSFFASTYPTAIIPAVVIEFIALGACYLAVEKIAPFNSNP